MTVTRSYTSLSVRAASRPAMLAPITTAPSPIVVIADTSSCVCHDGAPVD